VLNTQRSLLSGHSPDANSDHQEIINAWDADIGRAARALALRSGTGSADADDFAQEARLRLLTVRHASAHCVGYLRSVISNAIRTARRVEFRYDARRVSLDDSSRTKDLTVGHTTENTNELLVRLWVQSLPERLQRVYDLLYVNGDDQRTAARVLRVSQPRIAALNAELLRRGRCELQY